MHVKVITPTVPASDSFFSAKNFYATEHMHRDDAQKWETTLTRTKTKRAASLNQPAFDVSYIAREHGHGRSEEHTSELQSLMRISYAVFCLQKKITQFIQSTYSL